MIMVKPQKTDSTSKNREKKTEQKETQITKKKIIVCY